MATPTLVVKKYPNRRLYDTDASQYITLDQLEERIREGRDVRVVDAQSGDDLTQATLTQIIIEGRGAAKLLPVPLLLQLIRMGDDALAEFLSRYMLLSLEAYQQAKAGLGALVPFNPFARVPLQATSAVARMMMGGPWFDPYGPPPQGQPAPSPTPPPPVAEPQTTEMAELRRELEELKRALKRRPRR